MASVGFKDLPTIMDKMFEANSSFRLKCDTMAKFQLFFKSFWLVLKKVFVLVGGLSTKLSCKYICSPVQGS